MVMTNWASRSRRTWTRLAIRGENRRFCAADLPVRLGNSVHKGATPDQTDQLQVPVQPGPETALVVTQPQELLAVLVEPLDGPPTVGDLELALQGKVVQMPGEIPARLPLLTLQGPLSKQPALRTGLVTNSPMDSDPACLLADDRPAGSFRCQVQRLMSATILEETARQASSSYAFWIRQIRAYPWTP